MGWLLDLTILLIIGITVFLAYKRGFVKTLISACSFLIAILLTSLLAPPLTNLLKETAIAKSVEDAAEEKIVAILDENAYEPNDLFEGKSEEFNKLVSFSGVDKEQFLEEQNEKREVLITKTAKTIAEPIIGLFASVIAIIIVYVAVRVGLGIGGFFLDKLTKLPFLNTVNKTFGIGLGVVLSIFRVMLFCIIVKVLVDVGEFIGNDFLASLKSGSVIFNLFAKFNIFSFFI